VELAENSLEPLRKDEEFVLYRGQHRSQKDAGPPSFLLLAPVSRRRESSLKPAPTHPVGANALISVERAPDRS
jgi:hypothetical protein